MNKLFTFILSILLISASTVFAQDQTIGVKEKLPKEVLSSSNDLKVLIIPFEEKMYFSEFDREIADTENINFNEIRNQFRKGIDTSLYGNLLSDYDVINMLRKHPDFERDLERIYGGITYNYEEVPLREQAESLPGKAVKATKSVRKPVETSKEDKIVEGQLVSSSDNKDKYMAAIITDKELLPYLNEKYSADYFIFINQLDIKRNSKSTSYDLEADEFLKDIKIHFTILNSKGERVASGLSATAIPSKENTIYSYLLKGIKPATAQIAKLLTP